MRLLVLGGDGMLGHQLLASWTARHTVAVTLHRALADYAAHGLFSSANTFDRIDAGNLTRIEAVVRDFRPDAVVNGIGIVKQRDEAKAAIPSIEINAVLPHRLLEICRAAGARFVHVSTDCVFSGRTGGYRETDVPDPVDLYGRSKLLGEVQAEPGLTLRTSIIGLELSRCTGLIEWFLAQRGMIRGFERAVYSGVTTRALARTIEWILLEQPGLHGVWQVGAAPITKYALLTELSRRLARTDIEIAPDRSFVCDRSFLSDALVAATGYRAPAWDSMLDELAADIQARDGSDAATLAGRVK